MITYEVDKKLSVEQYVDLLNRSTLAKYRPIHDKKAIGAMLSQAQILITAWDAQKLVGAARTLTDFLYIGYLADLCVDTAYQKRGIGKKLTEATKKCMGPNAQLLLIAAPEATHYYPKIGFREQTNCWIIDQATAIS
jgi:ribosomal protein S18 acetylase RimI-like enzyme